MIGSLPPAKLWLDQSKFLKIIQIDLKYIFSIDKSMLMFMYMLNDWYKWKLTILPKILHSSLLKWTCNFYVHVYEIVNDKGLCNSVVHEHFSPLENLYQYHDPKTVYHNSLKYLFSINGSATIVWQKLKLLILLFFLFFFIFFGGGGSFMTCFLHLGEPFEYSLNLEWVEHNFFVEP